MTFSGYPSRQDCAVCGEWDDNMIEPRFGYVVCKAHYDVPPADIHKAFTAWRDSQ